MKLINIGNDDVSRAMGRRQLDAQAGKAFVGEKAIPLRRILAPIPFSEFGGTAEEPELQYLRLEGGAKYHELAFGESPDDYALVAWRVTGGKGGSVTFDASKATRVIAQDWQEGSPPYGEILAVLAPGDSLSVARSGSRVAIHAFRLEYDGEAVSVTALGQELPEEAQRLPVHRLFEEALAYHTNPETTVAALRKVVGDTMRDIPDKAIIIITGSTHPIGMLLLYEALREKGCLIYVERENVRVRITRESPA